MPLPNTETQPDGHNEGSGPSDKAADHQALTDHRPPTGDRDCATDRIRTGVQGRPASNGSTSAPPAMSGFDGSKCSRNSRFRTSEDASRNASFRLTSFRSAMLKKASPK